METIANTMIYDKSFGTCPFCKNFKSDENIDDIKIDKNSKTTTSLATFIPAIITTDVAR